MKLDKISKENIIQAIKKLENEESSKNIVSKDYDLYYEDNRYSPKVVISKAYKISCDQDLDHGKFGATESIRFLKDKGFLIVPKRVNIWKVSQPEYDRNEGFDNNTCSQGWNYGGDLSWLFYNYHTKDIKLGFDIPSLSPNILNDTGKVTDLLWNSDEIRATNAFRNLIKMIKHGDIIIVYKGKKAAYIGEIPKEFRYLFFNKLEFANSLYPIKYYKLSDVFSEPMKVTSASAQGIKGIENYGGNRSYIEDNWYTFRIKNKITNLFLKSDYPEYDTLVSCIKENINKSKSNILNKMNSKTLKPYTDLLESNKNLIFTGAPGTGKTYLAKQIAKEMGVCELVQFHPSYDYTDFVEGLRPVKKDREELGFELRDGLFKSFCRKAQKNINDSKKSEEELKKEDIVIKNISDFLDKCIDEGEELELSAGNKFTISEYNDTHIKVKVPNNAITSDLNLAFSELSTLLLNEQKLHKVKDIREFFKRSHNRQSDSYIYTLYNNKNLKKDLENNRKVAKIERKNYVFIIDEINRAEISKVFGELFFSIDPNYRGKDGKTKTQYSNLHDENDVFYDGFYVPKNVYIIGTMNDIDRSVESFDFAMRRRFAWKEIKADDSNQLKMLDTLLGEEIGQDWVDTAKEKLEALNYTIWDEKAKKGIEGLNSAYHIGPAYFLKIENYKEKGKGEAFQMLWDNHLKVLLQEYLRGMRNSEVDMTSLWNAYNSTN